MGLPGNALDGALAAGANLATMIENAGNEGGMVHIPLFYGKEEEDVNDWVKQFEVAFTAIGKAPGANGIRQAAYAATCLKGAAAQWYLEMKELNAGNLVNWADVNNDNDLKHRIKQRFTRDDIRRRKMQELMKTEQGINESVESYTQRFRQTLRIAARGHALDDEYQVNFFIEGLQPKLSYEVGRQQPGNLNGAVNLAKREEEAINKYARKVYNKIDDIERPEVEVPENKPKHIFEKPLEKNYEDDLVKMFEKFELKLLDKVKGQGRPSNNRRIPPNRRCFNCRQPGHYANECDQENYGRPNNQN